MRITILFATFFLIINVDLFSQGGVDVKYIPIDSINKSYIGQKIKIDFKSTRGTKEYVIQKARIPDTVKVTINGRPIELIEVKGTGVDYWYFDKEYLESLDYSPGLILRIKEMEILDVSADSVQFQMVMDQFKKAKEKLERVSTDTKIIWILRKRIEGILIKKW